MSNHDLISVLVWIVILFHWLRSQQLSTLIMLPIFLEWVYRPNVVTDGVSAGTGSGYVPCCIDYQEICQCIFAVHLQLTTIFQPTASNLLFMDFGHHYHWNGRIMAESEVRRSASLCGSGRGGLLRLF